MTYSLESIESHWRNNEAILAKTSKNWVSILRGLVPLAGEVIASLEGKKSLPENCTHLLLSKGFNHSLATYALLSKGLVIDASLTARNAIETFLMLELFATDSTENHFKAWANGREFKPAWVRSQLGNSLNVVVRDVIITFDDDYYETVGLAYSFWSGITHCNLRSAQHSVKQRSDGSYAVPTAGSLDGQDALVNCLFTVVCSGLLRTSLIASAVFSVALLQKMRDRFGVLQTQIGTVAKHGSALSIP
jgi:hypothetical protein